MINSFITKMNRKWRWRQANVRGFIFEFYKLLMRSNYVLLTSQSTGVFTRIS